MKLSSIIKLITIFLLSTDFRILAQTKLMSDTHYSNISEDVFTKLLDKEWVRNAKYHYLHYTHTSIGKYGVIHQTIDNRNGIQTIFVHKYKIFSYGNGVLYNGSILKNDDSTIKNNGILILNRDELDKNQWSVAVGNRMVVLTTAEHVKNAQFKYDWSFNKPSILNGMEYWHPNYRVDKNLDIINVRKEPDYDAEIKSIILCDYDNNLNTISDNFIFVAGSRIIILK